MSYHRKGFQWVSRTAFLDYQVIDETQRPISNIQTNEWLNEMNAILFLIDDGIKQQLNCYGRWISPEI